MHSGEPAQKDSMTYKMIYLESSHLEKEGVLYQFTNIIHGDSELREHFINLFHSLGDNREPLVKEISLTAFTGYLSSHYGFPHNKKMVLRKDCPAVDETREYIGENLDRNLSLQEMATLCGYSPYHFLRLFKASTGMTPHQYITHRRVERAKELIAKGLSPAEIAAGTGFTDQSHFANTFRKYTGATPRQYFLSK